MSTVLDAFKIARSLLLDDDAVNWSDPRLMPKMIQAHGEMVSKLVLNGLPYSRNDSTSITVAAGALSLGLDAPSDLIKPIKMDERGVGELASNAVPMSKVAFFPNRDQTDNLVYWTWNKGTNIKFMGATTIRVVHLYYEAGLTAPTKVTDELAIPLSETFLGPRIVALCTSGKKQEGGNRDLHEAALKMADDNLSMIVRTAVKGEQNLPVRRRPFSATNRARRGMRY